MVDGASSEKRGMFGAVVVAVLLFAPAARAAPGVVKVFEAPAREAPSADAKIVHVFTEQTKLFVSEEVTDGWRRVRLPEGQTAYVRDDQIKLLADSDDEATPPKTNPSDETEEERLLAPRPVEPLRRPPPVSSRPPRVRTTIYVKDLDHLAELVASDQLVHPQAESLATRHTVATVSLWGGNLAGAALVLAGATVLGTKNCFGDVCTTSANFTAIVVGCAVALAGTIGWLAIIPRRSDLLDVINTWNERHPSEPFTMDHEPGRD